MRPDPLDTKPSHHSRTAGKPSKFGVILPYSRKGVRLLLDYYKKRGFDRLHTQRKAIATETHFFYRFKHGRFVRFRSEPPNHVSDRREVVGMSDGARYEQIMSTRQG